MTVDMNTAEEMLQIKYKPGMHDDINERVPLASMFQRELNAEGIENDVHRFAIKIAPSQNHREYGTRSPAQFDRIDGEMVLRKVDVTYNISMNPIRINPDVVWRAAGGQASMVNLLKETLRDLRDQESCQLERGVCTGNGHNLYFTVRTVPVAAPWTVGVENYGGYQDEEIGSNISSLNMLNLWMNASAPVITNSAYQTVRNAGAPGKVTGWDETTTTESITFDREFIGLAVGDVLYRSRDGSAGVQGINDGPSGLVDNVDNFVEKDPFQTIASTSDTAVSFRSAVQNAATAAINGDILNRAISVAQIKRGGSKNDGDAVKNVFTTHPTTVNEFSQSLTNINHHAIHAGKRVNYAVGEKGFKPQYGYEREYTTYNGVHFIDGQLHLRNSTFLINLDDMYFIHNGPREGNFLSPAGGGPQVLRVPGTPLSEYVWAAMRQLASQRRNANVRIYNHAAPDWGF